MFQKAQQMGAILLTTDRDFFHTVPHLYESHRGVIVIALRQPNRAAILSRMKWALAHIKEGDFSNRVFQLRDKILAGLSLNWRSGGGCLNHHKCIRL